MVNWLEKEIPAPPDCWAELEPVLRQAQRLFEKPHQPPAAGALITYQDELSGILDSEFTGETVHERAEERKQLRIRYHHAVKF